jgi:hypothetical protein
MPQIVGKDTPSVTIYYYKGNAFNWVFTVSGNTPPSLAVAKIFRRGDPDQTAMMQFTAGEGLSVSGQEITLSKTAQEMFFPAGIYEFTMEGVIAGVHSAFVQRSMFVVNDAIGQQLAAPAFIVATATSDSEIGVDWDFSVGAMAYTLRRSIDGITWATIYNGPNTAYNDFGLTASTLYYYDVYATAPGATDSNRVATNATTFAIGGSGGGGGGGTPGGCGLPAGGNQYDTLAKASSADCDAEWIAFEEVPHDHDERYYTKDEIDGLNFGSGGVVTGTI